MTKVAVVTGSSSGIGYETSLLLARNQFTTYATMRNINKSDRLREIALKENIPLNVTQLDVNSDSSVDDAIENIVKENDRMITAKTVCKLLMNRPLSSGPECIHMVFCGLKFLLSFVTK